MFRNNSDHATIRDTWWNRNKGFILGTALATTVVLAVIQRGGLNQHQQYLKDKGLLEDYWKPEED